MAKGSNNSRKNKPFRKARGSKPTPDMAELTENRRNDDFRGRRLGRPHYDDVRDANRDKPDNDPLWYALNEQLLRDTASFSYGYAVGRRLRTGDKYYDVDSVPGVCAFYMSPTFGNSVDGFSPINVAARNIYSRIRYANSGSTNYDSTDLMIYLGAMDSVYSFLEYMKRIYGVARTYSNTNMYYPYALIRAMGMDPDDVQSNLNDFRAYINTFVAKVCATAVPATMPYMVRHMWMYRHIWVDSNTEKPQTYMYTPHAFYRFQLDNNKNGMLAYTPLPSGQSKVADLITYGNQLIAEIMNDEDFGTMSGDIMKAFPGNLITLDMIDENYVVLPEYSEEVMSQIENITMLGYYITTPTSGSSYDPEPNEHLMQMVTEGSAGLDAYLTFQPKFQTMLNSTVNTITVEQAAPVIEAWAASRIVNMHHGDVSAANTIVATRLTNCLEYLPVSGSQSGGYMDGSYFCPTMGSEIVHAAIIYHYAESSGQWGLAASAPFVTNNVFGVKFGITDSSTNQSIITAATNLATTINSAWKYAASLWAPFDWHPAWMIYYAIQTLSSAMTGAQAQQTVVTSPALPVLDYDNYTYISMGELTDLSESALLSEFNVPNIGNIGKR